MRTPIRDHRTATEGGSVARSRALVLIAAVQVLAMSVWFSASAVAPALRDAWGISGGEAAWLTGAVQAGFVAGALGSAVLNLADRVPPRVLIAVSSLGAAAANALVALVADGLATALPLRLATGVFLAGIYPVGMKLMATWFVRGRGLAIGVLVGALTLGSGSPHLISALGSPEWRVVVLTASGLALLGAVVILPVGEGPAASPSPPVDMRWALTAIRDTPVRLANIGYLGHMWELYALWAWLPAYLAASGRGHRATELLSFTGVGVAGLAGAVVAGAAADRLGRTGTTMTAMAVSGACALASPALFSAPDLIMSAFIGVWGAAVIADSAQFSVAVSELTDRRYVGSALTLQTAMGFLLTIASIRLLGGLGDAWGWRWALTILAAGPAIGIIAMWRLRAHPAAKGLAGGAR